MKHLKAFNEDSLWSKHLNEKEIKDKIQDHIRDTMDKGFKVYVNSRENEISIDIMSPVETYYYWNDISDDVITLVNMLEVDYIIDSVNVEIWPNMVFKVKDLSQLEDMAPVFSKRGVDILDEHDVHGVTIVIKKES